ncbi:MAG: hypothetical protein P4K93_16970 [Terracidiphilus sp.]|nr:hypothetical protein [Terracidiphilus sp.]MDR3799844.1 hypothetical protein [Terracidiphilus sp.]
MKDGTFHVKDVACSGRCACGRLGISRLLLGYMLASGLALGAGTYAAGQTGSAPAPAVSPSTETKPATPAKPPRPYDRCDIKNAGASMVATGGLRAVSALGVGETTRTAGSAAVQSRVCSDFALVNWYDRFVTGPDVMRFSPEQKFRLAVTNVVNPFNLGTIVGEAGIEVAANSHSPYGPGVYGWAKLSGTNLTQDMTDQFFGTFLIPSVTHTDPHYHRRPDFSIPHRVWHCIDQVVWQRNDRGGHTFNYSQIVAPVFDISISNLYVPGLETHFSADAERYVIGLSTAPIDNFITEFVPSIASHIHTHVVFVQRVINQVAVNPP